VADAVALISPSAADRRGYAVAVGGEVVPRGEWATTALADGANIEVVAAIQGG
jgi:sulfur carrier protein